MFRKLKLELLTSIRTKRINVFFLFLFLAFLILILTKLSKFYTNTIGLVVKTYNVPDEIVILNDSLILNATLKTNGFRWLKYYMSDPEITIDFAKDTYKKDSVFVWHKSAAYIGNTQFDKNEELLNITPDSLFFSYDVNTVKKIPITLVSNITYSPGYDVLHTYKLSPDSVTVIGPETMVSGITTIQTEALTLKAVKTNIKQTIKLNLPQTKQPLKFSVNNTSLSAQVEKFTEGTLSLPVEVINVPEHIKIRYFPKKVNVSYYVNLNEFNSISGADFKVVCDFSTLENNQSYLTPKLVAVPKVAKRVSIGQQHIEFIIVK